MSFPTNELHSSIAEISSANLFHNFDILQKNAGKNTKLLPMVKTNGYGHGIDIIQKLLSQKDIAGLGVASITEAIDLRFLGFQKTILCFGRISEAILEAALEYDITVVIHSVDDMKLFASSKYQPYFHLEIETGMHRLGVEANELIENQEIWKDISLKAKGVFSHFSESENKDNWFSKEQMDCFANSLTSLTPLLPENMIQHISNSGSILLHTEYGLDWARPGISLFGYDPVHPNNTDLKPVMTWKAPIIQIKDIQKGDAIGYSRAFIAERPMKIATVSVGYGDGFLRLYQKVGLGFQNKRVPIVGNVCMDLLMIDISDAIDPQINDDVYILGDTSHGEANANEFAKVDQTICYEVLSRISNRVIRIQT